MSQMLQMAQVFVSKSGSSIGCHVAQIFIDIHILTEHHPRKMGYSSWFYRKKIFQTDARRSTDRKWFCTASFFICYGGKQNETTLSISDSPPPIDFLDALCVHRRTLGMLLDPSGKLMGMDPIHIILFVLCGKLFRYTPNTVFISRMPAAVFMVCSIKDRIACWLYPLSDALTI